MRPLVFEGYQAGGVRGGQLMTTTEVENFPGFPEGITGPDLMDKMRQQAERWGSELLTEDVEHVDLSSRPFTIRSSDTEVCSLLTSPLAGCATARRATRVHAGGLYPALYTPFQRGTKARSALEPPAQGRARQGCLTGAGKRPQLAAAVQQHVAFLGETRGYCACCFLDGKPAAANVRKWWRLVR